MYQRRNSPKGTAVGGLLGYDVLDYRASSSLSTGLPRVISSSIVMQSTLIHVPDSMTPTDTCFDARAFTAQTTCNSMEDRYARASGLTGTALIDWVVPMIDARPWR
jgi:hypothetical protein